LNELDVLSYLGVCYDSKYWENAPQSSFLGHTEIVTGLVGEILPKTAHHALLKRRECVDNLFQSNWNFTHLGNLREGIKRLDKLSIQ
jgi:hypothetical protein